MGSTHHERPAGVARRFQPGEDPVRAANAQCRDVLNQHPSRAAFADEAQHVLPQATPLPVQSCTGTGWADVLTREAAADEIWRWYPVPPQPVRR